MPNARQRIVLVFILFLLAPNQAKAQPDRTVGLMLNEPEASPGYTLFAPNKSTTTYLIDMNGNEVHSWENERVPGNSVYLLENGNLLRPVLTSTDRFNAGGRGGRIQIIEPDGTLAWDFEYSNDTVKQHHDVAHLPNGNVLFLAWELKTEDVALEAGRDPDFLSEGEVWSDTVVEVRPTGPTTGEIVWKWDPFDHLVQDYDDSKDNFGVVAENPQLIDINSGDHRADWLHMNAVNYNAELDQIAVSSRTTSEIWVIDHSTTMEQSAGHEGGTYGKGGDLLYRWGNPQNYDRGSASDRTLFVQHDIQWIEPGLPGAGNMLVFNNGGGRHPFDFSSVDEFVAPQDEPGFYTLTDGEPYRPVAPLWSYTATPEEAFYSSFISGAVRMPNGNTLICAGAHGRLFEVTTYGDVVWEYVNPVTDEGPLHLNEEIQPSGPGLANRVFRAYRYAADYPGLAFLDLESTGPIEMEAIPESIEDTGLPGAMQLASIYPNPAKSAATVEFDLDRARMLDVSVIDMLGRSVLTGAAGGLYPAGRSTIRLSLDDLSPGVYLVQLRSDAESRTGRLVVNH